MKILWTDFAAESLKEIFDYYKKETNPGIAAKIRRKVLLSTQQLLRNPESGQKELLLEDLAQDFRYVLSDNYKVIYKIVEDIILITDVFDTRQNPTKLNRANK